MFLLLGGVSNAYLSAIRCVANVSPSNRVLPGISLLLARTHRAVTLS